MIRVSDVARSADVRVLVTHLAGCGGSRDYLWEVLSCPLKWFRKLLSSLMYFQFEDLGRRRQKTLCCRGTCNEETAPKNTWIEVREIIKQTEKESSKKKETKRVQS
jgi:hypothetical protein